MTSARKVLVSSPQRRGIQWYRAVDYCRRSASVYVRLDEDDADGSRISLSYVKPKNSYSTDMPDLVLALPTT
jgi:hypothetical protein